jgi:hypothetical protein
MPGSADVERMSERRETQDAESRPLSIHRSPAYTIAIILNRSGAMPVASNSIGRLARSSTYRVASKPRHVVTIGFVTWIPCHSPSLSCAAEIGR